MVTARCFRLMRLNLKSVRLGAQYLIVERKSVDPIELERLTAALATVVARGRPVFEPGPHPPDEARQG
jgi:hypothetical protein